MAEQALSSIMDIYAVFWFLFLSFILETTGFQYRCFRDICDSAWQFCNEDESEKRCSACTPRHCTGEVADKIFNQCETWCKSLIPNTTAIPQTTSTATPQEDTLSTWKIWLATYASFDILTKIGLFILLVVVIWYSRKILKELKSQSDVESPGSTRSASMVSCTGTSEKEPLLLSTSPVASPVASHVAQEQTDASSRSSAHSKVEDMRTLADAANGVSPPPSYATNQSRHEDGKMPTECCDDPHSGIHSKPSLEQDNDKFENQGDTELLTRNNLELDNREDIPLVTRNTQEAKEKEITRRKTPDVATV